MYDYFKNKYPDLFADKNFCGFDCNEGWKDILERLFVKIADDMRRIGSTVDQVKEKFGGLRFYTSTCNDVIDEAINEAEKEAWKTCEYCGSKEDIKTEGGWLKTLCGKCRGDRFKK